MTTFMISLFLHGGLFTLRSSTFWVAWHAKSCIWQIAKPLCRYDPWRGYHTCCVTPSNLVSTKDAWQVNGVPLSGLITLNKKKGWGHVSFSSYFSTDSLCTTPITASLLCRSLALWTCNLSLFLCPVHALSLWSFSLSLSSLICRGDTLPQGPPG